MAAPYHISGAKVTPIAKLFRAYYPEAPMGNLGAVYFTIVGTSHTDTFW